MYLVSYVDQVVLLNQVTTKFTDGSFQLTLALGKLKNSSTCISLYMKKNDLIFMYCWAGDSWSHSCTNHIILHWNGNERCAYIEKSPSLPSASAPYLVTGKGIRGINSNFKRARTTPS